MSPHQTESLVIESLTIKRSRGDLPVNFPVLIVIAPCDVNFAWPFFKACSWSSSEERFQ